MFILGVLGVSAWIPLIDCPTKGALFLEKTTDLLLPRESLFLSSYLG